MSFKDDRHVSPRGGGSFASLLAKAARDRRAIFAARPGGAVRVFSGVGDGMDGVYVDVYAEGAVLIVYEGRAPRGFDAAAEAANVLAILGAMGVRAVYVKPFAKDRSKMGGELPPETLSPEPAAGETLPEAVLIREHDWVVETRLFDGLSTGIFLDQRENRWWVAQGVKRRMAAGKAPAVLNTFAYTCAFSVAAARSGAVTTSVDVSGRYLEWGKRNFEHNGIDPAGHRFAKMDTFEFFGYAARKGMTYDLIILDPPSFASGQKKKGIKPWSSVDGYARLVREAAGLLNRGGVVFCSTNTRELCRPGRLEREVGEGLGGIGGRPKWLELPAMPEDFAREEDRFSAVACMLT